MPPGQMGFECHCRGESVVPSQSDAAGIQSVRGLEVMGESFFVNDIEPRFA